MFVEIIIVLFYGGWIVFILSGMWESRKRIKAMESASK